MILNHTVSAKFLLKLPVAGLILSTFFTIFFFSCEKEPVKEKSELKIDSLIYDETGKPFNGKVKDKIGNKTIEYDVREGKKHGKFKTYFESGQVEMEGDIVNNRNEGIWKYYYTNGQLESQGNFRNDMADGKWEWYFPWGVLRETAEYSAGLKNGSIVIHDSLGNVVEKKIFINGVESVTD